jgi:NADH-quinone oxidoreductase subunit C
VPDYDPLTISEEELKKLPPAERGAVYKARAAARAGGAAPPPAAASTPPAARPAPPSAPPSPSAAQATSPSPGGAATPVTTNVTAASPAPTPAPVAPAKPAPPPEPAKPKEPAFVQKVLATIDGSTFQWRHGYAELKVPRGQLLEAANTLKNDGFDYLSFITEVDWQDHLELIYHMFSYDYRTQPLGAILRCDLPRDGMPEIASLTPVWPGAEFMEREAFEMMGISFLGHPDLRRILLPDDFVGFPMRRDYENDWDYITVKQLVEPTD